ncbi:hypothetical protein F5B18DRAFT_648421 [Nemania serpens]|nr:hypothetical protein F5B18DRAFT_648421 [Nemania serpens]
MPDLGAMDKETRFAFYLSRALEEALRRQREETPDIPWDRDGFENPPPMGAPDVLFFELKFQIKQLLGALPSADESSVDISLLQGAVETLWVLLDALGVRYRQLRTNIKGEPEEDILKFYRTNTEALLVRKREMDLVRVEREMREEREAYWKRMAERVPDIYMENLRDRGFGTPTSDSPPGPVRPTRTLAGPTPIPDPSRPGITVAGPIRIPNPARPARIASATRQTRTRPGNRKDSRQPQRRTRPPPHQPPVQTSEGRVLRPRGRATNALAPSRDGGVKKPPTEPPTEPRYNLRSLTRHLK